MSQFTDKILQPESTDIDFSQATKLHGGGSTCDIYVTTLHRRKVFVKRLKAEYQDMPVYRSAFDKEFDIGVNLKHKSLPEYREFGGNYIVMDFIDGKTLADLLKNKDPWLSKERNVILMLSELIEVVDYLHQHNITHCDIKPDNIMITAGNRNLMLIDLDKCYTDWLNDTSGAASKFGLTKDKTGDVSLDFRGIGQIVELLIKTFPALKNNRILKFKEICFKKNIDVDELKSSLEPKNSNLKYWLMVLPLIALIVSGMVIWNPAKNNNIDSPIITNEPIKKDTVVVIQQQQPVIVENVTSNHSVTPKEEKNAKEPSYKELIEKELPGRFESFYKLLDEVESKISNPDISDSELTQLSFDMAIQHSDLLTTTYKYYEEKYPKVDPLDIQMVVAKSKAIKDLNARWDKMQQQIADISESLRKIKP